MNEQKSERRGRPRGYDPERALTKARDAFWRTGYAGTSVDALSDATDMNKPSLYGAFGVAWVSDRTICNFEATVPCAGGGQALSYGPTISVGLERRF